MAVDPSESNAPPAKLRAWPPAAGPDRRWAREPEEDDDGEAVRRWPRDGWAGDGRACDGQARPVPPSWHPAPAAGVAPAAGPTAPPGPAPDSPGAALPAPASPGAAWPSTSTPGAAAPAPTSAIPNGSTAPGTAPAPVTVPDRPPISGHPGILATIAGWLGGIWHAITGLFGHHGPSTSPPAPPGSPVPPRGTPAGASPGQVPVPPGGAASLPAPTAAQVAALPPPPYGLQPASGAWHAADLDRRARLVAAIEADPAIMAALKGWSSLNPTQRIATLGQVSALQGQIWGFTPAPISINPSYANGQEGGFDNGTGQIQLATGAIGTPELALNVITHEQNHCFEWSEAVKLMHDQLPANDPYRAIAATWWNNYNNYRSADSVGVPAYRQQPIEEDSFEVGFAVSHAVLGYSGVPDSP